MAERTTHTPTPRAAATAADLNHPVEERLRAIFGPRKLLEQAIHTAAEQLEILTATAIIATRSGPCSQTVARVARGSLLLVLAEGPHCVTAHWRVAAGASLAVGFDECLRAARDLAVPEYAGAVLVSRVVHRHGAPPGEPEPPGSGGFDMRPVLGALLAMHTPADRASVRLRIEVTRAAGICPAMVAVAGPASSGDPDQLSFTGPVLLPLALYADAVAEMADDADRPHTDCLR